MSEPEVQPDRLVQAMGRALAEPAEWRHRCVERIFIESDLVARHELTLEVTIPQGLIGADDCARIPLLFVGKRALVAFSLTDEKGCEVPTMTSGENGRLAEMVLGEFAAGLAAQHGRTLTPAVLEDIEAIIWSHTASDAQAILGDLSRETNADRGLRRLLLSDPWLGPFLGSLASNFILCAIAPVDGVRRRIFRAQFDRRLDPHSLSWKMGFGLEALAMNVALAAPGQYPSYHVEVKAPPDLLFHWATFVPLPRGASGSGQAPLGRTSQSATDSVHLFQSGERVSADTEVWLGTGVRASGLPERALFVAFITTIMLVFGAGSRLWLNVEPERDATVPIVVALPALYATFIDRVGEHWLARRLLVHLRLVIIAFGLASLAAAASLAVDVPGTTTHARYRLWLWSCLAILGVAGALLTLFGYLRARRVELAVRDDWEP